MEREVKSQVSLEEAAKRFRARVKKMTDAEALQTFVDAGILTPKGNVRKPYRGAIVPVSKKSAPATR